MPGTGRGAAVVLGLLVLALVPPAAATLDVGVGWTATRSPVVVTGSAVNDTDGRVVLHGELQDLGGAAAVNVSFQWGPSPALGQETPPQVATDPGPFQATLEGLEPDRTYYFRAKGVGLSVDTGETETFRTPPVGPANPFPSLWPVLVALAVAVLLVLFLLRERLPLPLPGTGPRDDDGDGEDQDLREVDDSLERLRAVRTGQADSTEREPATTALLRRVAAATGDGGPSSPPRRIDPAEARRRHAIFQTRLRSMDQALEADPEDVDALFAKATYLALRKEYDEAIALLNELTRLNPKYPGVWYLKAKVYQMMGDAKMAELCLMSASRVG